MIEETITDLQTSLTDYISNWLSDLPEELMGKMPYVPDHDALAILMARSAVNILAGMRDLEDWLRETGLSERAGFSQLGLQPDQE